MESMDLCELLCESMVNHKTIWFDFTVPVLLRWHTCTKNTSNQRKIKVEKGEQKTAIQKQSTIPLARLLPTPDCQKY